MPSLFISSQPDGPTFLAALDETLNDHGYVGPGL
jgi:uracil phosphoribosyltransferase